MSVIEILTFRSDDPAGVLAHYLRWANQSQVHATWVPLITYRGHARRDWDLLPALSRAGEIQKEKETAIRVYQQFEGEVVTQFRNRFALGSDWDDLEVLAYAQHHGAPTRLLDWSKNPIVGLWFAVSEKTHDDVDGIVFRLGIGEESKLFAPTMDSGAVKFKRLDDCRCGKPIHIFPCSSRVERSERQDSFFTAAKYSSDWIFRPLPSGNEGSEIKTYIVAARIKRELRRLLVNVGLDAYTIYGDPDSFGKSVSAQWDFSGYKFGKLEKDNHLRAGQ